MEFKAPTGGSDSLCDSVGVERKRLPTFSQHASAPFKLRAVEDVSEFNSTNFHSRCR